MNLPVSSLLQDRVPLRGERGDHAREDQDRHAVADAPLRDQLAQPHDEGGPGGHDQHDEGDVGAGERALREHVGEPGRVRIVEQEHEARGLQQRQHHRHVAGPLVDLLGAGLALLLPLLELGDHDRHQLHDDRAGDVGHDAEREDRQAGQRTAGEQVDDVQEPARVRLALQDADVHDGDRHVGAQPEDRDDEQREEDLRAEVRHPERVEERFQHGRLSVAQLRTSAVPPAASIFSFAAFENACARTVSFLSSSPRARTLIFAPLCASPCR